MTIEIHTPELERLMQEEIQRGHFEDVDDLLTQALRALRERAVGESLDRPRKRLIDVLTAAPFAGSELNIQRSKDYARPVDL
jgi:Arc/MetJ-type ribon-helix-helix transcriptional regulator